MKKTPIEERFWDKVDTSGTCWNWLASRNQAGYGQVKVGRRMMKAHRVAYELTYGSLPPDAKVRHECDNPQCVNPQHLVLGSQQQNVQDMVQRGRSAGQLKTHCPSHHEYTPENTLRNAYGYRVCRACIRLKTDRNREKKKQYDRNRIRNRKKQPRPNEN